MFPTINKKETGVNLRRIMDMRGVKPKDIQEYLGFGCVQSIYRWLDGVSMPKLFNQSVTFDYESKLIQYIAADELYEVTNKNKGIADKQYYQKQEYDEKFATLWRKLQREKLVKHSIEEIENSDLFKYSPYKELNDSQRQAVEDIVQKLKEGTVDKVVVNGMPGSGKTIVAVYLMKYLADSEEYAGKQIGFVVPQTSLRKMSWYIARFLLISLAWMQTKSLI